MGPGGPRGVQRARICGRADPGPGSVFSQLSRPGGWSNNNNMCCDHTLGSGGSLGNLEKAAVPQPHRSLAYFHDRDSAQDVHIWPQLWFRLTEAHPKWRLHADKWLVSWHTAPCDGANTSEPCTVLNHWWALTADRCSLQVLKSPVTNLLHKEAPRRSAHSVHLLSCCLRFLANEIKPQL